LLLIITATHTQLEQLFKHVHTPKMSGGGGCLWELRPQWIKIFPPWNMPMLMQSFIHVKVNFEKKSDSFLWEIFFSCTSQKYDNVTPPYNPFFAPLLANWSPTGG